MIIYTRKEKIENAFDIMFSRDYNTLETSCIILIKQTKEDGTVDIVKKVVNVNDMFEILDKAADKEQT